MKNPSEKKNLEKTRKKPPPVEDDPTGCIGCGLETPEVSRQTWEGAATLRGRPMKGEVTDWEQYC